MNTNIIQEYMNKVFTIVMLVITGACMCAGITISSLKLLGFYPTTTWLALGIFVGTCVLYFVIGLWFVFHAYKTAEDGSKTLRVEMMRAGKIFIFIVMMIQWNFLSYLIPSREFWAYAFFFLILTALFLDVKMTALTTAGILASIVVSSVLRVKDTLPVFDEYFVPEMVLRCVCVALSMAAIILITWLIEHYLISVKQEQLAENNSRVEKVLTAASTLVENLSRTSDALAEISQNESAATEELSATSETLLLESNNVMKETESSRENMISLEQCSVELDKNILAVETIARNLLSKSEENEILLKELQEKNQQVSESAQHTNRMSEELLDCVNEIGIALNVIDEISSSISLLALNASIEAARAGEAGRGFAVVAESVGDLAGSTTESLSDIKLVIDKLQHHVEEMSESVEESTDSLERQNETFGHTFESIQEMIGIIRESLNAITTMGQVHDQQRDIINTTVAINDGILGAVQSEHEHFNSISDMIEDNTSDIMKMTAQAEELDRMISALRETLLN